ncbi:MASE4 domain-containing protein [Paenibacillus chondroitinus]|uniref:histidine kinase n=1 Tax=Paenibacillus chondroitinus TaxID=59842 RepID=A0ABU6DEQ2_9BACL|nr:MULTISPECIES: MASE4 domain-containing protein [Paenibacillus]MCY9658641.1 MASE4 domain-containing protein [Paenibacillus anseongense]MEB4796134.1 MASE4 domain-containing protein [Paenibacillus chondroitinus]
MSQHQALPSAVYNLITMPSNRAQRRFAYIIGALVTLISLFSVPFVRVQLGEMPAFQPAIFSTVVCFELITAYVIYSQFKISRQPAVLALFAGYLYSAGMSLVYILAFPRVFADNGLFNSGPQTSVWLYALWHIGFPLAVLIYLRLDAKHQNVRYSARKAKIAGWCTFVGTIVAMTVCTLFTTHYVEQLPTVLSQGQLSPSFVKFVGIPIVILTFITLLIFYIRTKASTVTSTWLCVAILAMMLDVIIVLCGGGRFSLGWYVAKLNSFVCSNVVLAGMIYEFTKMYLNMADLYRKVKESEFSYKVLLGESQQAERTISEQNTIIEQMLESSHEAIIMCDTVGRVIFANRRVELFFENPIRKGDCLSTYCEGMRTSDTTFKSLVEAYFNQSIPPFLKRISRVSLSGEMKHYECYVNPIVNEGADTLRGHLFGFRDRTEEERIDEMKNEFVSIISHEIRTPLSSIMGFSEILATRNVTEDKRVKYVETIHKESMRLSNLINDFLDLQRLDSGRQVFHFQTLNAAHLVGEIVEQWQGRDNHEIELHVLHDFPFIHGDEERLKQVFHNLISNSIKYSPDRSKIDVYVERENGRVLIKIQDYGLGIPADALDKLFARFYRVDNSDRRKIGGTGLGLSIVKEIVEAHHGRVLVESELSRGSIFTVQFDEHIDR